jgi:hypothetical protein
MEVTSTMSSIDNNGVHDVQHTKQQHTTNPDAKETKQKRNLKIKQNIGK